MLDSFASESCDVCLLVETLKVKTLETECLTCVGLIMS